VVITPCPISTCRKSNSLALQASTIGSEGNIKFTLRSISGANLSPIALNVLQKTSFHFIGSRGL
jgi:hypothetical protein